MAPLLDERYRIGRRKRNNIAHINAALRSAFGFALQLFLEEL